MKFAFTPFDKAILAAILSPIAALIVTWTNGGTLDEKSAIAGVVLGLIAGGLVYLKGNAPSIAPAVVVPKA